MKTDLLFYLKLVKDLKSKVLQLNIYDSCVVNKIIERDRIYLVWNVDAMEISHMKSEVLDEIT